MKRNLFSKCDVSFFPLIFFSVKNAKHLSEIVISANDIEMLLAQIKLMCGLFTKRKFKIMDQKGQHTAIFTEQAWSIED